jgi:hypothetical protein
MHAHSIFAAISRLISGFKPHRFALTCSQEQASSFTLFRHKCGDTGHDDLAKAGADRAAGS